MMINENNVIRNLNNNIDMICEMYLGFLEL